MPIAVEATADIAIRCVRSPRPVSFIRVEHLLLHQIALLFCKMRAKLSLLFDDPRTSYASVT